MITNARIRSGNRLPKIVVIVPCHNYGHFLRACVDSIVSQSGVAVEIHIVDDASTDDSASVAEVLARTHRNVTTTVNETNKGHIATYNWALSQVDSDYVVLLSADDLLTPGALARATDLMESHPSVGLTYGHPRVFEDCLPPATTKVRNWSVWSGDAWIRHQYRRSLSIIYSPEAIVRTSVHHEAGYYRPEMPHSADLDLWLRIADIADVARVNGPDQAYRRVHPSSMMQSTPSLAVHDLRARFDTYSSFLTNTRASNRPLLDKILRKRICEETLGWACDALVTEPFAPDTIDEAASFAELVLPEHQNPGSWREYRMTSSHDRKQRWAAAGLRSKRRYTDSVRWRAWQRYGI